MELSKANDPSDDGAYVEVDEAGGSILFHGQEIAWQLEEASASLWARFCDWLHFAKDLSTNVQAEEDDDD